MNNSQAHLTIPKLLKGNLILMPVERRIEQMRAISTAQNQVVDAVRLQMKYREEQKSMRSRATRSQQSVEKVTELTDSLQQPGPTTRGRERKQEHLFQQAIERAQTTSRRYRPYDRKTSPEKEEISRKNLLERLMQEADQSLQLAHVLEKAKPKLSPKAKSIFDKFKEVEKDIQEGRGNRLSGGEYVKLIESALQEMSPETMQFYQDRGVKLVHTEEDLPWTPNGKNDQGEWEVKFPLPYKKPLQLVLRAIEVPLQIEHMQDADVLPEGRKHEAIPSPERRAEIHARVFEANAKLGKYGWDITGYEEAVKRNKYYYDGIREAFKRRKIDGDTSNDKLQKIGHAYAHWKLIKDATPQPGEPKVFPSFGPAAYFEERLIHTQQGQKPMSMGSSEFVDYLKVFLSEREKRRKNSAFTFNIMPNGVYGQPYFISKEVQSNHPANTLGKPPEVSGTVKFAIKHNGDKVKIAIPYMDLRSGHFRTVDNKHPDPLHVAKYALKRFEELGFDTSEARIEASSLDSRDQQYSEP